MDVINEPIGYIVVGGLKEGFRIRLTVPADRVQEGSFVVCENGRFHYYGLITDLQLGNLIPNIDHAWDEIAYYQIGDNPGRKEPTTGEINYKNVFKHIHEKGFTGILGMEHGNSRAGKEGERAVIDAYRQCDID